MNEHSTALEAMITDFCAPRGVRNPNTAMFGKPKEDRFTHPTDKVAPKGANDKNLPIQFERTPSKSPFIKAIMRKTALYAPPNEVI